MLCDPQTKVSRALAHLQYVSTHAHERMNLMIQTEWVTVSNAPNLSLIVVFPIVCCNYFVGAPQRATDHNLALGLVASKNNNKKVQDEN